MKDVQDEMIKQMGKAAQSKLSAVSEQKAKLVNLEEALFNHEEEQSKMKTVLSQERCNVNKLTTSLQISNEQLHKREKVLILYSGV